MKYKYFSILFLAVFWSLGHITFSDTEIPVSGEDTSWWSEDVTDIIFAHQFDGVREDIKALSDSEQRLTIMETLFQDSQKNTGESIDEQKKLLQQLQDLQKSLKKNISDQERELVEKETEIKLLEDELLDIETKQSELTFFIRRAFAEKYKHKIQNNTPTTASSLLLGSKLGIDALKSDTQTMLQESMEGLLIHQKTLEESHTLLKSSLTEKLEKKTRILERLIKKRSELKEQQTTEQISLNLLQQKESRL